MYPNFVSWAHPTSQPDRRNGRARAGDGHALHVQRIQPMPIGLGLYGHCDSVVPYQGTKGGQVWQPNLAVLGDIFY